MTLESGEELGKLFVGGLSWDTTAEKLREYFTRYGEVVDCVVMKNPETGRSRGFGFISFKDASRVEAVLNSGPHLLDGRTIDPKSCNAKGAQKGKREVRLMNYPKVFLGGLPPDVNETLLRNFFSKYGKVVEVVIMYNQEKKSLRGNGFRGFGFLSFESEDSVNTVTAEHFVTINGKKVEVKRAEPRDKQFRSANTTPSSAILSNTNRTDAGHAISFVQSLPAQMSPDPLCAMASVPYFSLAPSVLPGTIIAGPSPPLGTNTLRGSNFAQQEMSAGMALTPLTNGSALLSQWPVVAIPQLPVSPMSPSTFLTSEATGNGSHSLSTRLISLPCYQTTLNDQTAALLAPNLRVKPHQYYHPYRRV